MSKDSPISDMRFDISASAQVSSRGGMTRMTNCFSPNGINALVYEMATRNLLFSRFRVVLTGKSLVGEAWRERLISQGINRQWK